MQKISRRESRWLLARHLGLLRDFGHFGCAHSAIPFSCEYDLIRGRIKKISLYACAVTRPGLRILASHAGTKRHPWIAYAAKTELDCLGADLLPDGSVTLKIYEKHRFQPAQIPSERIRRQCVAIARHNPVRDLLLLRRISPSGELNPPDKTILRLENGIPAESLPTTTGLSPYARFLSGIAPLLNGLNIFYLGFGKRRALEICARRDPPPWLPP